MRRSMGRSTSQWWRAALPSRSFSRRNVSVNEFEVSKMDRQRVSSVSGLSALEGDGPSGELVAVTEDKECATNARKESCTVQKDSSEATVVPQTDEDTCDNFEIVEESVEEPVEEKSSADEVSEDNAEEISSQKDSADDSR